jgi:hypothetical protein
MICNEKPRARTGARISSFQAGIGTRPYAMIKRNSRLLAILLLAGLAAISLAGQPDTLANVAAAEPAGCHQHGAKPPASTPASHRCCQAGHNSAILQNSQATRPPLADAVSSVDSGPGPDVTSTLKHFRSLTISPPDSPPIVSLRV